MLAHGKCPCESRDEARETILTDFWEELKTKSGVPLPVFRRAIKKDEAKDVAGGEDAFVEHEVTEAVLARAGFEEGTLVRGASDKNIKTKDVWRITSLEDSHVMMAGAYDNDGDTVKVPMDRFQSTSSSLPSYQKRCHRPLSNMEMCGSGEVEASII